ncbi:trimethylamine methyltransferase family protein [Aestuariivirga litoralis]|uniref:trimethylamine methyltransferase family protein n=1 Tax=Aestuariivirga litoralis TaxID=2650924 RepID=UPI0018C777F7|nr:trimethylamine methyltransferase family protein [Aestuariivirga litoralis]MBG1232579.1 trimethylamine methyltransferase family protein [Aestuariivirga litoralis]
MEQAHNPRRRRASSTEKVEAPRAPYINRKLSTFSVLSEEGLALIEANADTILHDTGMEFVGDPEIIAIFKAAGCDVQDTRVRFERGFCRKTIQATAPKQFTQHARNPANNVVMGGSNSVLCPSWGPPFVHDLDKGRRYATYADFTNLVKLHQTLPWLHHSGGVVCEPVDLPANKRHLDMLYAHIRWSDRPFMGAFIGAERAGHAIEMARIVFGADYVANNPVLYCVSNTNAPLVLDSHMSGALKTYARANQPVACTPWVLTGAMSPTTVAGTLAQVLAEATACLALVQLINPGAPCLMGSFASTMSMQSGAPTFGTPEAGLMVLAAGQLARRLGVPLHTVGTLSASKLPDAQSEQEATWGLLMSMFAGANLINHATGWLEGGLVTSFEKTIIDHDLCGKVARFFDGIDLSENAQAMSAIAETGPGQHFLGSDHTRLNFMGALFRPLTPDNNSFEQWQAEGGVDAATRANRIWKRNLEQYQDPGLDPAIDEALQAYIAKVKSLQPDQNYY